MILDIISIIISNIKIKWEIKIEIKSIRAAEVENKRKEKKRGQKERKQSR